jgi:hypothetical protein
MLIAIPVIKEWLEVMPPMLVPHHATDAESVLVYVEYLRRFEKLTNVLQWQRARDVFQHLC